MIKNKFYIDNEELLKKLEGLPCEEIRRLIKENCKLLNEVNKYKKMFYCEENKIVGFNEKNN